MALDFVDGFDHYSDPTMMGWVLSGDTLPSVSGAAARTGGQGLSFPADDTTNALIEGLTTSKTMVVGFALYVPAFPADGDYTLGEQLLCSVFMSPDGGTNWCEIYLALVPNDLGPTIGQPSVQFFQLNFSGPSIDAIGSPSTEILTAGWHYIEMGVTVSSSGAGVTEVRVDGTAWLNHSSVTNSLNLGTDFGGGAVSQTVVLAPCFNWTDEATDETEILGGYIDDFYVTSNNALSSPDTIFLGVAPLGAAVQTTMPSADGSTVAFTRTGTDKGANFLQVNEVPPDGDTTTVTSSNPGDVDVYAVEPVAAPRIYAVAVNFCAKGPGRMAAVAKYYQNIDNQREIDSGDTELIDDSWNIFQAIFELDPRTNEDWTPSGFAQDTFGVKVTA